MDDGRQLSAYEPAFLMRALEPWVGEIDEHFLDAPVWQESLEMHVDVREVRANIGHSVAFGDAIDFFDDGLANLEADELRALIGARPVEEKQRIGTTELDRDRAWRKRDATDLTREERDTERIDVMTCAMAFHSGPLLAQIAWSQHTRRTKTKGPGCAWQPGPLKTTF